MFFGRYCEERLRIVTSHKLFDMLERIKHLDMNNNRELVISLRETLFDILIRMNKIIYDFTVGLEKETEHNPSKRKAEHLRNSYDV
jgi:hypothetical protein